MSYFLESEGGSLINDELSDPEFAIGYVDGSPIFEGDCCLLPGISLPPSDEIPFPYF